MNRRSTLIFIYRATAETTRSSQCNSSSHNGHETVLSMNCSRSLSVIPLCLNSYYWYICHAQVFFFPSSYASPFAMECNNIPSCNFYRLTKIYIYYYLCQNIYHPHNISQFITFVYLVKIRRKLKKLHPFKK